MRLANLFSSCCPTAIVSCVCSSKARYRSTIVKLHTVQSNIHPTLLLHGMMLCTANTRTWEYWARRVRSRRKETSIPLIYPQISSHLWKIHSWPPWNGSSHSSEVQRQTYVHIGLQKTEKNPRTYWVSTCAAASWPWQVMSSLKAPQRW